MADPSPTTRDKLLEAARELFTTTGYHATTTPQLARHAGVAEGTIYRHFPSKHALLNAAYQDAQRWGLTLVRAADETAVRGAAARLAALGRTWFAAAETDPARVRMLLSWRLPGELDDASHAVAGEFRGAIEQLIALGKQEGSVRAGVVELWTSVWLTLVTFGAGKVASKEWAANHPHAAATLEAAWEAIAWRPIVVGGVPATERAPALADA